MITKFQALVSRESLAPVYPVEGRLKDCALVVHRIRTIGDQTVVETDSPDGDGHSLWPLDSLEPSAQLLSLIDRRIYREDSMTWHDSVYGTQCLNY